MYEIYEFKERQKLLRDFTITEKINSFVSHIRIVIGELEEGKSFALLIAVREFHHRRIR